MSTFPERKCTMSIVSIVNVSEDAYTEFCSFSIDNQWAQFKHNSNFTYFENNLRLVIFHEIFFRALVLCSETGMAYRSAMVVIKLFQEEMRVLVRSSSVGPGNNFTLKQESAARCKEMVR